MLFALADMVTRVEVAGAFCRRAERLAQDGDEQAPLFAAMSRIFAREALGELARVGRLCAVGFTPANDKFAIETAQPLMDRLSAGEGLQAMAGHWLDMTQVAKHLEAQGA